VRKEMERKKKGKDTRIEHVEIYNLDKLKHKDIKEQSIKH
jgi:hypothetical protein